MIYKLKYLSFFSLFLITFLLFILGNYIYTIDTLLIIKILVSESCFVLLYTFIDKYNLKYGSYFTIVSILLLSVFYLPIFSFLFYSQSVQIFSVSISIVVNIIDSLLVRKLFNKGFKKIFSSQISTIIASMIEISIFAYLLDIGLDGATYTTLTRVFYIYCLPKIVLNKKFDFV